METLHRISNQHNSTPPEAVPIETPKNPHGRETVCITILNNFALDGTLALIQVAGRDAGYPYGRQNVYSYCRSDVINLLLPSSLMA